MPPHSRHPRSLLATAVLAVASLHAAAQTARFDIPAQPLPEALALFAAQSGATASWASPASTGRTWSRPA